MRKRKKHHHWLRRFRHVAERKANGSRQRGEIEWGQWSRAKRRSGMLPDPWEDYKLLEQKTWKVKRETQYRPEGRGKEHALEVDINFRTWDFTDYLDEHSIPYRIEDHKECYYYWSYWAPPVRLVRRCITVGHTITWWSDKDIGIEYILGSYTLP